MSEAGGELEYGPDREARPIAERTTLIEAPGTRLRRAGRPAG